MEIRIITSISLLCALAFVVQAQQPDSAERIYAVERQRHQAPPPIDELNKSVQSVGADINRNNRGVSGETISGAETTAKELLKTPAAAPSDTETPEAAFVERIVEPELGGGE